MSLSRKQKDEIVKKLRQSETLKNATTSNALLQYLYEATIEGVRIKEEVIYLEFYGAKNYKQDTTRVRVNVYNLRKKLTQYYVEEGRNDLWQLTIEKGQYKVSFVKSKMGVERIKSYNWGAIIPSVGLVLSLLFIIFLKAPPRSDKIWNPFFKDQFKTFVYVGDMFTVAGKTIFGRWGWTRSLDINNRDDLLNLLEQRPELIDSVAPSQVTLMKPSLAVTVQHLQRFFQNYNQSFSIRFSTKVSITDITEGNAIYCGPITNQNEFVSTFNKANPYFIMRNGSLILQNHPSIQSKRFQIFAAVMEKKYVVVSKYPNPNGTTHLVFFSQDDDGLVSTIQYFTDPLTLSHFIDTYLKEHQYFTAVFTIEENKSDQLSLETTVVVPFDNGNDD